MKREKHLLSVLLFFVWVVLPYDGELNVAFGNNGTVLISSVNGSYPDGVTAVALQDSGKIIAAGENFVITRYTEEGELDPSFGHKGIVKTQFEAPFVSSYVWAAVPYN